MTRSSGAETGRPGEVREIFARLTPLSVWRIGERLVESTLFLAAIIAILATLAILFIFLSNAYVFFLHVSPAEFFLGTRWSPVIHGAFGFLPLLWGTLMIAVGASLVGLPLGLGAAIYMYEYAPPRARAILKPTLEVLAGIPTVVLGFFALIFIGPILQDLFGADFFNALNGILVIGILIVPLVASLSEDAMSAVPRGLRDGALAMGSTRLEALGRVVLPAASSGIFASFFLAIGRAMGETMIVVMATGASPRFTFNPLESIQTIQTEIALRSLGDLPVGSVEYLSIFALGLVLFAITFAITATSGHLGRRFREVYQ